MSSVASALLSVTRPLVPASLRAADSGAHYRAHQVVGFTLCMIIWPLVFAVLFYVLGQPTLAKLAMSAVVLGIVVLLALWITESSTVAGHLLAGFYFAELMTFWVSTGGLLSPTVAWVGGIPIVATLLAGRTSGMIWTFVVLAATGSLLWLHQFLETPMVSPDQFLITQAASLGGMEILALSLCTCFELISGRAAKELDAQQSALKQLLHRQEIERQLLGYDIHDGLTQTLTGAAMRLDSTLQGVSSMDAIRADLEHTRLLLHESLAEARRLIYGLRPTLLDELGLAPAIEELVQREPRVVATFTHRLGPERPSRLLETAIFRICQEALSNVAKHGDGASVSIDLVQSQDALCLTICDQGPGLKPAGHPAGFGLEGIRQRARILGGTSAIDSRPAQGTTVRVELPLTLED